VPTKAYQRPDVELLGTGECHVPQPLLTQHWAFPLEERPGAQPRHVIILGHASGRFFLDHGRAVTETWLSGESLGVRGSRVLGLGFRGWGPWFRSQGSGVRGLMMLSYKGLGFRMLSY
jgi:hypothetical protein